MAGERILVIDDDDTIRFIIGKLLKPYGYQVVGSGSVATARAEIALGQFDLVLLDHHLSDPVVTGVDLLLEIRVRDPDVPVIVMSGDQEMFALAIRALDFGAVLFAPKPICWDDLITRIALALKTRDEGKGARRERCPEDGE